MNLYDLSQPSKKKKPQLISEMDKSQKGPPGWNVSDDDSHGPDVHLGPDRIAKASDVAKKSSDTLTKAFQDAHKKKDVEESSLNEFAPGGESLLRDLEAALHETPARDLMREYRDFVKEAPVVPQQQSNKPSLGVDLTKPGTPQQQQQQQQQQDPAQQAAQQKLAQQEKIEQNNLQKGVANLKAAGAAVSNPAQVVKAFDKVDDQQPLTPADKGAVATAGTVLAPIMANPQLQGKFKDLVTQASAEQKKQQQQQQAAAPAGAPVPGTYRDWETDRKSTRLNSSHRL